MSVMLKKVMLMLKSWSEEPKRMHIIETIAYVRHRPNPCLFAFVDEVAFPVARGEVTGGENLRENFYPHFE